MAKKILQDGTNALLIYPAFPKYSFNNFIIPCEILSVKYVSPPLGLLTVASILPQGWNFKLIDENISPLKEEDWEWADIIFTGGMFGQRAKVQRLISKSKDFGIPVVVGGPDATLEPQWYTDADYLVLGEGELSIPLFIQELRKGKRKCFIKPVDKADIRDTHVPRFDLITPSDYMFLAIQFSRGCPFLCEFCDIRQLVGRTPRCKSERQIIKELEAIQKTGYIGQIEFVDDNFVGNKMEAKKLLRAIIHWSMDNNYPFIFSTEVSVNIAKHDEILDLMCRANFKQVFIGIESVEDRVLKKIKKYQNVQVDMAEAIRKFYQYGMHVGAGVIIGMDEESEFIADKIIKLIYDSAMPPVLLSQIFVVPNSALYLRLKSEGRLLTDEKDLKKPGDDVREPSSVGLNFITQRSRNDILHDYIRIIDHIYDPKVYYERATRCTLQINSIVYRKPGLNEWMKNMRIFYRMSKRAVRDKTIRRHYWRLFFTVIIKNAKAIDKAIAFAILFEHFRSLAPYLIQSTKDDLERLSEERSEEKQYSQIPVMAPELSNPHPSP